MLGMGSLVRGLNPVQPIAAKGRPSSTDRTDAVRVGPNLATVSRGPSAGPLKPPEGGHLHHSESDGDDATP